MSKRLRHTTIMKSWRRAKLVVIDLDSGDRIVVQPRFTGALLIDDGNLTASELDYSTLKLDLDDGRALHYADVRRLGTVALMDADRFEEYSGKLGMEPLDPKFTGAHLSAVLRATSLPVKKVLMEQRKCRHRQLYANERSACSVDPSRRGIRVAGGSAPFATHRRVLAQRRGARHELPRYRAARGSVSLRRKLEA